MDTLKQLYKIGPGPSSSHTMGPQKAALAFLKKNPDAHSYAVELWGSLAATGKGHLTDFIIIQAFEQAGKSIDIIWAPQFVHPFHPNGMKFMAYNANKEEISSWIVFSIGGGALLEEGEQRYGVEGIYPISTMNEILDWCKKNDKAIWELSIEYEGQEIFEYVRGIWHAMQACVQRGLKAEGVLEGGLNWPRRAKDFLGKVTQEDHNSLMHPTSEIYAYTLAASEENAGGGTIVTAPTCGAAGVIPGLTTFFEKHHKLSEDTIVKGLLTAGIIGNVVKTNASISGAEAGCQAEVGTACSMAAGMSAFFLGGTNEQIEYAAEIGLEHHLGLTCDPIQGLVQSPCIERNAVAAVRALDAAKFALLTNGIHPISFDMVVRTMLETGRDLMSGYRETSEAGLAKLFGTFNL